MLIGRAAVTSLSRNAAQLWQGEAVASTTLTHTHVHAAHTHTHLKNLLEPFEGNHYHASVSEEGAEDANAAHTNKDINLFGCISHQNGSCE